MTLEQLHHRLEEAESQLRSMGLDPANVGVASVGFADDNTKDHVIFGTPTWTKIELHF